MSIRGAILGLLGAALVSGVCYFNDEVIRQGMLVPHLMPVAVYGSLVLFLLLLNPLLRRVRPTWVLRRGELAVIVCLTIIGCSIASWGLVQFMPTSTMMPHYFNKTQPGWQAEEILKSAPSQMLVNVTEENEDAVLTAYTSGMSQGKEHISFGEVPWYAWLPTLAFWVPLMICLLLATSSLAIVFHRQWVRHEQLPYPISVFAHSLLPGPGKARGGVFRQRAFWVGALLLFCIHMNNYLCRFWPDVLIPVRLWLDFTPLSTMVPTLIRGQGGMLLRPTLYFAVIALAYFIPSDVSFSMGTIPFIFCYIQGTLAGYGIMLRQGNHLSTKLEAFLFTGGYFGIMLMVFYTGRHYYMNVLRRSVGMRSREQVEPHVVWAMRIFMVATVAFVTQLSMGGLDWQLSLLYTGIAFMIFIVVSRTIAETGAFHIGSEIFPGAIIIGIFGAAALGPRSIIMMFLLSAVLLGAPGWSSMPFLVQGLKLADMSEVRIGRLTKWIFIALGLSLLISLPMTIYWQYDQGVPKGGWPRSLSSFPFETLVKTKHQLAAQGSLVQSEAVSGWGRFAAMRPTGPCILAFFIAVGLALGIGFGRLRFRNWPFHPVVFVFLGGHQAKMMGVSFLIGWLVKALVNKYGGARVYQATKPFMIGILAGEMSARLVPMLVGSIVYFVTGQSPQQYFG
jgi:hypothetical protein